ncbi:MAG: 16S rRNA (guanine(966)-N(2))-methyltransferase RsmD [Verrucomicrobiaceae bacterium]|nr:16S rRNA (guanine(966)-N(2))-methyltransferase RsmD [Verrucomicrobiaceae bacterium]
MRIISGMAGGLSIDVPRSVTRPTTDKVRQAIFSMLGEMVPGARVIDLFAGSGALGLEALSRGAETCLFVDEQRQACDVIRRNLGRVRLEGGEVRCGMVNRVLADLKKGQQGAFDIVFADPPYQHERTAQNWAQLSLDNPDLAELLSPDGALILEYGAGTSLQVDSSRWLMVKEKEYGGTKVCWLKKSGLDAHH